MKLNHFGVKFDAVSRRINHAMKLLAAHSGIVSA